jgi:hypothetical protein
MLRSKEYTNGSMFLIENTSSAKPMKLEDQLTQINLTTQIVDIIFPTEGFQRTPVILLTKEMNE